MTRCRLTFRKFAGQRVGGRRAGGVPCARRARGRRANGCGSDIRQRALADDTDALKDRAQRLRDHLRRPHQPQHYQLKSRRMLAARCSTFARLLAATSAASTGSLHSGSSAAAAGPACAARPSGRRARPGTPRAIRRIRSAACGDSGSPASATTAMLPACCAICPPGAVESGRIAALKHLLSLPERPGGVQDDRLARQEGLRPQHGPGADGGAAAASRAPGTGLASRRGARAGRRNGPANQRALARSDSLRFAPPVSGCHAVNAQLKW